jgi:predicted nucleotidyltransferase
VPALLGERWPLLDNGDMARPPDAVLDTIRERLERRPEILEAYLFGSQARGEAMAHSDIDIAVYVDRERLPPAPWGYAAELITDLMSALGRNEIDVVVLNDAPPLLYHRVLRDGERLLSRDLAATTTREGYAISRYCDYLPVLRKIDRELDRRLEDGSFGR